MLSCFLSDDTLAIFEPIMKNSGIVGGKYLERRQVTHADSYRPRQGSTPPSLLQKLTQHIALGHILGLTLPSADS